MLIAMSHYILQEENSMKQIKLPSTNNKDELQVYIWETADKPKAIVQLSHGMVEYLSRYNGFAQYLCEEGFLVIGNDHLGHGYTAREEDLGYFGEGKSKTVVDDLYSVTEYAKKTYGDDIPYFLFGHSMGSFMARRYVMTYGQALTGAIICGTGSQPAVALGAGKFLAGLIGLFKGERYRPNILDTIAFGAYNKRIENPVSKSAWLTKDEEIIKSYDNDKFCTFKFTVNGYKTLFDSISFIQKKENINSIPKALPLFLIAGAEDPVGEYGKGVKIVYDSYLAAGIKDVEIKLYEGDRHEILNELDKENVYKDISDWIEKHL